MGANVRVGFRDKVKWLMVFSRYRLTIMTLDSGHQTTLDTVFGVSGTYMIPKVNMTADKIFSRSENFSRTTNANGISMIQISTVIWTKAPAQNKPLILMYRPSCCPSHDVQK
jgi:hypothetical protein